MDKNEKKVYHPYRKDSSYVRNALYKVYNGKCFYCGIGIYPRHMHVDHILPTNRPEIKDEEIIQYVLELEANGFIQDSIENYLPTCSSCNQNKSNLMFKASNLRFYHECARKHLDKVLSEIDKASRKEKEFFYEPVDLSIWDELTFSYQRDISHAILGYRLTSADVNSCPQFPQVEKTIKQLSIVDYAAIQGETGCGKSISLFQVAYNFFKIGWKVYLLKSSFDEDTLVLPDNTENSLYIIDDAQIYTSGLINQITRQSRCNRKVLFAKTISDSVNSDSIVLTNKDAVDILYKDYLKRKTEIIPIVKRCDNTVGDGFSDIPIERRLEEAKTADTPWQFSYILRGGWETMKELYESVCNHNNCDLLAAAIATFQILQLDKAVNCESLYKRIQIINPKYKWNNADLDFLINRKIVISNDEIRIVHLESAYIIVALFFEQKENEKQTILLETIENALINREISSLGIVWLCNGCRRHLQRFWAAEEIFLTDQIINNVSKQIHEQNSSEEIRNTIYLLDKIIVSDKKENGINILTDNKNQIIALINNADSISAWGFGELLNSIYNYNHKMHNELSQQVSWSVLMKRMMQEQNPNYFAWGHIFNRGLLLLGQKQYCTYSEEMFEVLKCVISKATFYNIKEITSFLCSVSFLNYIRMHTLMPELIPVYELFFNKNMGKAIYLFDFDFMCYICGMDLFGKRKPLPQQEKTAKMIVNIIPDNKLANVISRTILHDWLAIRDIMYFIYYFDFEKYANTVKQIDLKQLSEMVKNSWDYSYEISLIFDVLATADTTIAKEFLLINADRVMAFYPIMISIDPAFAIKTNKTKGVKIDLFADHQWDERLLALKALSKTDKFFSKEYLKSNITQISNIYSNVCALDFTDRNALDLLKEIEKIDREIYKAVISTIDKNKVLEKWNQCGGISNRKKHWVEKRKKEYFEMIGLNNILQSIN